MGSYAEPEPEPSYDNHSLTPSATHLDHLECFIPAATSQCHASNLLFLRNGYLLCAWFGGTQEGKPDISIYVSSRPNGSNSWLKATRATCDVSRSEQNPVLFQTPGDELWLLYTSQNLGDQDSAVVKRQVSIDDGISWSIPEVLFSDPGTFIRQPVVTLDDGALVVPTFKCRSEPGTRWVGNDDISAVIVSKDQGRTWIEREVPYSFGAVHMAIRKLRDGSFLALYRSRWADSIYLSRSANGIDWTAPEPTTLPNPNAGICFEVFPSGRVLAVYNHSSRADAKGRREGLYDDIAAARDVRKNQTSKYAGKEAFWGAPRAPLCLAWSDDDGKTWRHTVLEDGDGYCMTNNSEQKLNRDLFYPSIALGPNGTVHIAFTYWRQAIKYVELNPSVLDKL